ncbi:GumC family protein [Longimicrobium sp.]|uniref:GumC family protein n=1 Tax=Longimicrobium sp. TaxID=2029185 RepID=UPI003B3A73B8
MESRLPPSASDERNAPANRVAQPPSALPAREVSDGITFRDFWYTIVGQRWLVLGVTLAAVLLTALVVSRQQPRYKSEATLRVNSGGEGIANPLEAISPGAGGAETELATDMVVLRSRQVAEAVAESLSLNLRLEEPARTRDAVLMPLVVPPGTPSALVEMEHRGNGEYSVRIADGARTQVPQRVRIGTPFQLNGATLALAPRLSDSPPDRVVFRFRPLTVAATQLRANLEVYRPDPRAQVVHIRYDSEDPELASEVPNAVSRHFIQYKAAASQQEARSAVEFLQEQVTNYEVELARAETRLQGFREQEQVVNLQDQASQQVRRLAELQASVEQLRSEREALTTLLAKVRAGDQTEGEPSPYRQLAAFPSFLQNPAVNNILNTLTDLENQRTQLLVRRTTENLDVQGIDQRIRELELHLYRVAQNHLESLDSQIRSEDASLSRFGTQIQLIPAREVQFARLARDQDLLTQMYTLLQTRLKEAEIRRAVEPATVEVIDEALVPRRPYMPRPLRSLVLAGVLGLITACALAVSRRALDTRIRTREDAQAATGGAPILGAIPRIKSAVGAGAHAPGVNGDGKRRGRKVALTPVTPEVLQTSRIVTRIDPHSPASEAYRALRTNLTFSSIERPPQVVVVTSALPGDGKSTSAANLAVTLAQQGTRTLLIDGDVRRGVLHQVFELPQTPGLTNALLGRDDTDRVVYRVPLDGENALDVIPAGVFPPNPSEILGSQRMRDLLASMRARYEMIIVDAPPLNLVTDAAVLGTASDTTVLVARVGITDKRALQHAATQLFHLNAPLAGVVLNDIDLSGGSYYGYSYGYGYGYSYSTRYAAAGKD